MQVAKVTEFITNRLQFLSQAELEDELRRPSINDDVFNTTLGPLRPWRLPSSSSVKLY